MDAKQSLGEPRALISREALLHNVKLLRKLVGRRVKICAVVKANAYGHDAPMVIETLCSHGEGAAPVVDCLAVATIDEALELPPTSLPVIIFHPVENTFIGRQRSKVQQAILNGWNLTICTPAAADDVARVAMLARRQASVQIMIDTGMTRAGVVLDDINRLLKRVQSHASLRLSGFYTHFACADDLNDSYTHEQMRRFRAATDGLVREIVKNGKPPLRHAANSAGLFFLPVSHMDMIRPGISLYGIDPSGRPSVDRPLRPVMKWVAPLIGVRELKRGGTVGYGRTWTADRDARIGLVPVGYGDGYRRALSNRGVMLVAGRPAPVVGRVSMDLTTIDLTGIPDARIGDEVTILDDDALSPCSVYQLARLADTIPYEILCGIGQRVKRVAVEPQPAEAVP